MQKNRKMRRAEAAKQRGGAIKPYRPLDRNWRESIQAINSFSHIPLSCGLDPKSLSGAELEALFAPMDRVRDLPRSKGGAVDNAYAEGLGRLLIECVVNGLLISLRRKGEDRMPTSEELQAALDRGKTIQLQQFQMATGLSMNGIVGGSA